MTDQVLDILKLVLLALLYLFFARVLWAVWSEVRQPAADRNAVDRVLTPTPQPTPPPVPEGTPTGGTPRNWRQNDVEQKPPRGTRSRPARLVVIEPKDRKGTAFAIGATAVTIGREPHSTIVIADDAYVSGHHATVSTGGDSVVIDDAGSKNGTYLNGTRITNQRTVHTGDRIQIGATVLEAQ